MPRLADMWHRFPVVSCILLTFLGTVLASAPNVADPIVRHDDFPALLGIPELYYEKTLFEGRWLNYWWHLRSVFLPSWANYAIYLFCWSVFAAALAMAVCGRHAIGPALALSLLVALTPTALAISFWFNTLIPGVAVLAVFALMATRYPPQVLRWWLLVFVPLSMTTYTTYPLLMLLLVLAATREHSLRDLTVTMLLFVISFALGLLAIYSLNYTVHGIFGVPMASWREATPPTDFAGVLANLQAFGRMILALGKVISFGNPGFLVFIALLISMASYALIRTRPGVLIYVLTGCCAGLGLLGLQILRTGIEVQPRAAIFVSVGVVILVVLGLHAARDRALFTARLTRNALLLFVALQAVFVFKVLTGPRDWQTETRQLADTVQAGDGAIFVWGSHTSIAAHDAAAIEHPRGLQLRLRYLTGRSVVLCDDEPDMCDDTAGKSVIVLPKTVDLAKLGRDD